MSDELQTQQQEVSARPGRYVVVTDEDGRRRVARADGQPLGTPFVRTAPLPAAPTTAQRASAFLRGALERGAATIRGGRPTAPVRQDDAAAPTGEAIKARREALGLSQRDLAALAGRARGLLAEVEKGTRNAVESRKKFGDALALREANRAPQPADAPPLPRGE